MTSKQSRVPAKTSPGKVLVVEGDDLVRQITAEMLREDGYVVLEASSRWDAIRVLETEPSAAESTTWRPVDAVVMALAVPEREDGFALLEWIRDYGPDVPVIVVSADGSPDSMNRAFGLGAFKYVTKPISLDELLSVVKDAVHPNTVEREHGTAHDGTSAASDWRESRVGFLDFFLDFWKGDFDAYSEEFLFSYAHLRAVEWSALPLFAAQPIAPIALVFFPAWTVVTALILLGWAWRPERYRLLGISFVRESHPLFTSSQTEHEPKYSKPKISARNLIRLAEVTQTFAHLKWPISIAAGIWLFEEGMVGQALLAGLWPVITLALMPFAGASGLVGAIQKRFLLALGFKPPSGGPASTRTNEFHRRNCEHSLKS